MIDADAVAGKVVSAADEAAVSEIVRACVAAGRDVVPTGGRHFDFPVHGDDERVALSLAPMNEVIEHEVQDLTLTCQAGCTVAQIQERLATYGQRVAFEVADPQSYSIGGVIAAACEGFVGAAFGPVRDQILGMEVVLASGEKARTGGRVVKNVTGYDLAKLYTGSHGALGVITSVTLRLRAQASATRTLVFDRRDREAAFECGMKLRDLPCASSGIVVAGGHAVHESRGPWLTAARIEGRQRTLDDIAAGAASLCGRFETLDESDAAALWGGLAAYASTRGFVARLTIPSSRLAEAQTRLQRAAEDAAFGSVVDMHAGRLDFTLADPVRDVDTTCGQLILARLARDFGGHVAIPSDPSDRGERVQRFASPTPDTIELMRRIKHRFDPSGHLGRGRLFAGVA